MLAILQHLIPMALGWLAKFLALRAEDKKNQQEMMLGALSAKVGVYKKVREHQTPAANFARRAILFFLMGCIGAFILGYAVFEVPILVETSTELPSYFFGLFGGGTETTWTEIRGIPAFDEVFVWMTVLIEFWFGAQLAKRG